MVYRVNRDPIIDNDRVLRVDRMRVNSYSQLSNSHMQGTTSGYTSGGNVSDVIDKFPFSSDANASDVGDLTIARYGLAGQSSSSNGYSSGGFVPSIPGQTNVIDKFPFSTDANATDVGDLTNAFNRVVGQSSTTHGYVSGGYGPTSFPGSNIIQKFTYASDANATDVGDLTVGKYFGSGHSSPSNGYFAGGGNPTGSFTTIDKFPFAADANATDVGNIGRQSQDWNGGISSDLSGYMSFFAPSGRKDITKFSFTVDGDTQSEVGDLSQSRREGAGQNSTASGYVSGGLAPPPSSNTVNTIDKFPFSADADATDVGDLTRNTINMVGQQV